MRKWLCILHDFVRANGSTCRSAGVVYWAEPNLMDAGDDWYSLMLRDVCAEIGPSVKDAPQCQSERHKHERTTPSSHVPVS